MIIWIDFTNTPHVNFFLPIIRHFEKDHEFVVTARDFSETLPFLDKNGINFKLIGTHKGKSKIRKVLGLISRVVRLLFYVPKFDLSMSIGGQNATPICFVRGKPSIVLSDNDTSYKYHSYKLGSYFVLPFYYDTEPLIKKYGVKRSQIHTYNGFIEDVYIADYKPDKDFINKIPFKDFITIRPENLKASYVPSDANTIVPELFAKFRNENILFLPHYKEERKYADGYNNIFIPNGPLSGLDMCYFTKAMLTGAGSFAREAAILGTPAVSFFPGKYFLTVDKIMQEKGWEFKSRNTDEIFEYVNNAPKRESQIKRSKNVQKEVIEIIENILRKYS